MNKVSLWCCVEPERRIKTIRLMASLAPGWGERAQIVNGLPPDDDAAFAIWGHLWTSLLAIPRARATGRPFWFVDNGYWKAAKGEPDGYYRISYRGPAPVLLNEPDMARGDASGVIFEPWRKDGRHILIACQSPLFGGPFGIDNQKWINSIVDRVRRHTDRPIIVRPKGTETPLGDDFRDCWAVVTHSSNVAVEAAVKGIPVFVERESAAVPVGNLDLADIENPRMPDGREHWWRSLMCQQFTLAEMADGTAYRYLRRVREQVDG